MEATNTNFMNIKRFNFQCKIMFKLLTHAYTVEFNRKVCKLNIDKYEGCLNIKLYIYDVELSQTKSCRVRK